MGLEKRVKAILEENFPGACVHLSHYEGTDRIDGKLIWPGFEEQELLDRHTRVRHLLRERLGKEADRVFPIMTYTPTEFNAIHEGEAVPA